MMKEMLLNKGLKALIITFVAVVLFFTVVGLVGKQQDEKVCKDVKII